MKLVTATVQEHVLADLRDTLLSIGITAMTIFPATNRSIDDMDAKFDHSRPRICQNEQEIVLETVVSAAIVAQVVNAISSACNKAASCSVSISVSDVRLGVRIRNSELVAEG